METAIAREREDKEQEKQTEKGKEKNTEKDKWQIRNEKIERKGQKREQQNKSTLSIHQHIQKVSRNLSFCRAVVRGSPIVEVLRILQSCQLGEKILNRVLLS